MSKLNPATEARVDELLAKMTLEEKVVLFAGKDDNHFYGVERLNIPECRTSDGPVGVHGGNSFPPESALASTFNRKLAYDYGKALGEDCRALGVHVSLGPGMNMQRNPVLGRNCEYLGEDPFLAAVMAPEIVKGVQSQGVMACAKHFIANSIEIMRTSTNSVLDERTMRELYLPAFEACVKKGEVGSIMGGYNNVNGMNCCRNTHLLKDILKDEWEFDGMVISDWGAGQGDPGITLANGLDIAMPNGEMGKIEHVRRAMNEGTVTESDINEAARRILRQFVKLGFFDRDQKDESKTVKSEITKQVSLKVAEEGTVLLKNNGVLPINRKKVRKIALFGSNANARYTGVCGSSHVDVPEPIPFYQALKETAGEKIEITLVPDEIEALYENSSFYHYVADGSTEEGLVASYYKSADFNAQPDMVRIEKTLNTGLAWSKIGWLSELNGGISRLGVIWDGCIKVDKTDVYTFAKRSNGGMIVTIDGEVMFDDVTDEEKFPWLCFPIKNKEIKLAANKEYRVKIKFANSRNVPHIHNAAFGFGLIDYKKIAKIAKQADLSIVATGYNYLLEGEGIDRTFKLPFGQDTLIETVSKSSDNTVVILESGGACGTSSWIDNVDGFIQAWYPGQWGHISLAKILFGDVNPSGKLPSTFDKRYEDNPSSSSYFPYMDGGANYPIYYREGIFMGYRGYDADNKAPLYPFGHGLSYTEYEYKNITVNAAAFDANNINDETVFYTVSCDVKNTGKADGTEIVQLYVRDLNASVMRPIRELKGFERVTLNVGEIKNVTFNVTYRDLSFYDVLNKKWTVEPGAFKFELAASSRDIRLSEEVRLK